MIRTLALAYCCAVAAAAWGIGGVTIDSPRVDVPFTSSLASAGLRVHSIQVGAHGALTSFFIDYESDSVRGILLFDPPSGAAVRVDGEDSLPAGRHEVRVQVESARLAGINGITIMILGAKSDSIFLTSEDLRAALARFSPPGDAAAPSGVTRPVPAGPQTRLQGSDEETLAESGILLDRYTLKASQDGGLSRREYARNGITDINAAIQEVKLAGGIDALHARMPSLQSIVEEFGPPARVVVNEDGGTGSVDAFYGMIDLYFVDSLARLAEIRIQSSDTPYRLRGALGVDSTLDDVLGELGRPLSRLAADSAGDADRVLYTVAHGAATEQCITYAAPGVRFFMTDGTVTAMHLVAPGAPGAPQKGGDPTPADSGSITTTGEDGGSSDDWGPEDIFVIP